MIGNLTCPWTMWPLGSTSGRIERASQATASASARAGVRDVGDFHGPSALSQEDTLPAPAHVGQRQRPTEPAGQREGEEAPAEAPGRLFQDAQDDRQHEAAEPAGGPDDPGHHADLPGKPLRDDLEHAAVAHPQRRHDREQQGRTGEQRRQGRHAEHRRAHDQVESGQHADATEAVGEITAQGPQHRSGDHAERREVARLDLREPVLAQEEDVEEARQPDESAEGDRVEQAEPPGVGELEHGGVVGQGPRRRLVGAVPGEDEERGEGRQERDQRQAEHGVPAPGRGEPRAEERGQGRTAVAGAGDPHHQPLESGRVPAPRQRQRRGEARPRHAQQQADEQHLGEAIRPEPAEEQGQR